MLSSSIKKEWRRNNSFVMDGIMAEWSLLIATLLLLLAAARGCLSRLLLVHDELLIADFLVPLEAGEVGLFELVVLLWDALVMGKIVAEWAVEGIYLLLELLVDCI
jgi:hypothetical protein